MCADRDVFFADGSGCDVQPTLSCTASDLRAWNSPPEVYPPSLGGFRGSGVAQNDEPLGGSIINTFRGRGHMLRRLRVFVLLRFICIYGCKTRVFGFQRP